MSSPISRYAPCMYGATESAILGHDESTEEMLHGQVTVSNATSTTDDALLDSSEGSPWPPSSLRPPLTSAVPRKKGGGRRNSGKSVYKHVPHKDKPVHLVARRNARERRRVQAVNSAFARLRKCVPVENRSKRLSKVKTLHRAIEYIDQLQNLLDEADAQIQSSSVTFAPQSLVDQKENNENGRWPSSVDVGCRQDDYDTYASFYDGYSDFQN